MQGINKAKHAHLIDALLGLERLVSRQFVDDTCMRQIVTHRDRLRRKVEDYDRLLVELAMLITAYEALYSEVKVHSWLRN